MPVIFDEKQVEVDHIIQKPGQAKWFLKLQVCKKLKENSGREKSWKSCQSSKNLDAVFRPK